MIIRLIEDRHPGKTITPDLITAPAVPEAHVPREPSNNPPRQGAITLVKLSKEDNIPRIPPGGS